MSGLASFPLFPLFPKEIRLEIWTNTLQPRVITFECELYNFSPQHAPQTLYLVGGDQPYTHFEIDIPQRPPSPYYLVQACPRSLGASPPLLNTCHESRDVALRSGYRRWKIQNQALGIRHVMWNPKYDAISLQMSALVDESCIDVFVQQFPEQVKEIRHLSVDAVRWLSGYESSGALIILRFSKLRELAVAVDADNSSERQVVDSIEAFLTDAKKYLVQKSIPGSEEHQALAMWHPPRIRAVGKEDELLSDS